MYNYFGSKSIGLSNLRTVLICILFFMGFLQFSEVLKVRRCNIITNKTILYIFIEKTKTDLYREGSWVYLTKLDTALCPM